MSVEIKTHLLVIGAGPVGIFSVFMAGMAGISCCVLEASEHMGGQCTSLYAEKPIYDIPGFPSILSRDLIDQLWAQAKVFDPALFFGDSAQDLISQDNGRWLVSTEKGKVFDAGAILLCVGHGAFSPIRPALEKLEHFESKGCVLYQVANPSMFENKRVLIAGGGDSAVDWAILLSSIAQETHLVHRRHEFRAQSHTLNQLYALVEQQKIQLHTCAFLDKAHGDDTLSHISLNVEGSIRHIETDYLLPFFGTQPSLGALFNWGLVFEKGRICIDPTTAQTNRPGIYAAGDGAVYPHKLKLILTGFSEASAAAHHIKGYLFPEKRGSFQHSTSTGVRLNLL